MGFCQNASRSTDNGFLEVFGAKIVRTTVRKAHFPCAYSVSDSFGPREVVVAGAHPVRLFCPGQNRLPRFGRAREPKLSQTLKLNCTKYMTITQILTSQIVSCRRNLPPYALIFLRNGLVLRKQKIGPPEQFIFRPAGVGTE